MKLKRIFGFTLLAILIGGLISACVYDVGFLGAMIVIGSVLVLCLMIYTCAYLLFSP